jgi:hypothetical protein
LGGLDAQGGVLGDQHRGGAVLGQAQAGGEHAMVGGAGIEDLGEAIRRQAVGLDAQGAPAGQGDGLPEAAGPGGPLLLEEPDGPAGIGSHLVEAPLLAVQLLHHHQRDHHVVLLEAQGGGGIGQQHAGVEHVGAG